MPGIELLGQLKIQNTKYKYNKLASLEATLVRNSAQRLSDAGEV